MTKKSNANTDKNSKEKRQISNTECITNYIRNFNKINNYNYTNIKDILELSKSKAFRAEYNETENKLKFIGFITYSGKEENLANEKILGYVIKNISEETIFIQTDYSKTKVSEIELSQGHKTCILHNDLLELLSRTDINAKIEGIKLNIKEDTNLLNIKSLNDLYKQIEVISTVKDKNNENLIFRKIIGIGNLSKETNIEYLINYHKYIHKKDKLNEKNKLKEKFIKKTIKESKVHGKSKQTN